MLAPMTKPRTRTTKPAVTTPRPSTRALSTLALVGDAAKRAAQRQLLLSTLEAHGWDLTATAEALGLTSRGDVHRAITDLGLTTEYATAKGEAADK